MGYPAGSFVYVLGWPVSVTVVGMSTVDQVEIIVVAVRDHNL